MKNRKPPTEREVQTWLRQGKLALPPLSVQLVETAPFQKKGQAWDYFVDARWGQRKVRFAVEYKAVFTPMAFEQGLAQCLTRPVPKGCQPLLMLPYLRPAQLETLEAKGVSGIDWCGNGIVLADNFSVYRTGGSNQFLTYSPIKNIYRKNTSMVPRVFLSVTQFEAVGEVVSAIIQRDRFASITEAKPITKGTVSKALKQLEEDLVVDRSDGIRLLQPDKLLTLLAENYQPSFSRSIRLKVDCDFAKLPDWLTKKFQMIPRVAFVSTGLSAVGQYATMQREEVIKLYCSDLDAAQSIITGRENDRFPNLEIIESDDQTLYFDALPVNEFCWASPVQTWLELQAGDKRDQETANQVRDWILRKVGSNAEWT